MSTGKIAFQRISISETNCVIQWIEIHPVDSFIYLLNNQGRFNIFALLTRNWRTRMNFNLCIFKMASPTWVTTQPRLYRTNILGFTRRKQKRWFRNVDNWILQSWLDYVKTTTRHRNKPKQSGVMADDSCFAILVAHQYGATNKKALLKITRSLWFEPWHWTPTRKENTGWPNQP